MAVALSIAFQSGCRGDNNAVVAPDNYPPVISLVGDTLVPQQLSQDRLEELRANYLDARAAYEADPDDPDALIWYGRRAGYLWEYRKAINIFSDGVSLHPSDARMYRHRGHRLITVRNIPEAIADFEKAAELIEGLPDEVEPDGQPNAAGIPTSTLHTNIWYHLGLAYYLQGDFKKARDAFQRCLDASSNNDMRIASTDWLYMSLRRLGLEEEAQTVIEPITADMEVLENHAYHRRILMYKGLLDPDALLSENDSQDRALSLATQGYGLANWYLYSGETERARELFKEVIEGEYWAAFGYIAAEAELARGLGR